MKYSPLLLAFLCLACAKKPKAPEPPTPGLEKVYGPSTDVAQGRGHTLEDMGFSRTTAITFIPVYFAFNSATLEPQEILHHLADELPAMRKCRVEGHACPLGTAAYNNALAYHRAQAVVTHLRTAGVRTGLEVISYGEEKPATLDEAEYHLNRRVTVECEK